MEVVAAAEAVQIQIQMALLIQVDLPEAAALTRITSPLQSELRVQVVHLEKVAMVPQMDQVVVVVPEAPVSLELLEQTVESAFHQISTNQQPRCITAVAVAVPGGTRPHKV